MNKFAFIIHPIEVQDFYKRFPILKNTPDFTVKSLGKLLRPFKVSDIKGISTSKGEIQGYLIVLPLDLEQTLEIPEEKIAKKIIKAGKLARKLGADIVGLEAYTSIIGDGSLSITEDISIPITTGRAYTILSAINGIKQATALMGKDFKECDLTIIGINEASGRTLARYLAKEAKYISLASDNKSLLEKLSQEILIETGTAIHISKDIQSAIKRGDIIVIAANTKGIENNFESIKKGAIVCDLSRPRTVGKEVEKKRQDVLFIDSGIIKLPYNVDFGFDFGFPPNTCSPALAETILLSIEKEFESFSISREIEIETIDSINKMAQDNNFNVVGVSSLNREVHISNFKIEKA